MEHRNNPDPQRAAEVEESVSRYARGPYAPGSGWIGGFFVGLLAEAGGGSR